METKKHAAAAEAFNKDEIRTDWHDETLWIVRTKRDKAAHSVSDWEELREHASQIKDHTLSNLDNYLKKNIKVSGMFSGTTLYIDSLEEVK